jgi:hypothetical protein
MAIAVVASPPPVRAKHLVGELFQEAMPTRATMTKSDGEAVSSPI